MYNSAGIVFTGSYGNQCAYFSKAGKCIIRAKSSLTGARVARDPAFAGFRKSGNRMKEASPIAAGLYKLIPREQREYRLYRVLTGEALRMIKAGMSKETIIERLKEMYIDPILNPPVKKQDKRQIRKSRKRRYADGAVTRNAAARARQQIIDGLKSYTATPLQQDQKSHIASLLLKRSLSGAAPLAGIKSSGLPPVTGGVASSGPIYLGREKKFRKFKMWLMPEAEFTPMDMRKITELIIPKKK